MYTRLFNGKLVGCSLDLQYQVGVRFNWKCASAGEIRAVSISQGSMSGISPINEIFCFLCKTTFIRARRFLIFFINYIDNIDNLL